MNKADLAQTLNAAATALSAATTARAEAAVTLNTARAALSRAESEAVRPYSDEEKAAKAAGQPTRAVIEGGNEGQRKAAVIHATDAERRAEDAAEIAKINADAAYDLAKIEWDRARQLVTIFSAS